MQAKSVGPDQTAPIVGPHILLHLMLKYMLQKTMAFLVFRLSPLVYLKFQFQEHI